MIEISKSGRKALKIIFSDFTNDYNAHNIRKKIEMSEVGSWKLLKNLADKKLLIWEKKGHATFYKPNLDNPSVIKLLEFVFTDNSDSSIYVKGWLKDIETFKMDSKAAILFGPILIKEKNAGDVDVCFILRSYKYLNKIRKKIEKMNHTHKQKLHPLFITKKDLIGKLKERDKPLINLIQNNVVVFGQDVFVEIIKDVSS